MNAPLKILIFDDSPNDIALMKNAIAHGGVVAEFHVAHNVRELISALQERNWDLILSDYSMPQFTGLDALALWKKEKLDAPFLIISGAISDAEAVAAMRAGARDCIRKNDLGRLVPAIEREVREAAERRSLNKRYLTFSKLGQRLSSASSPQEAARIITKVADELLGWDSCFVDLYAPEQDKFYHVFDMDIVDGRRQELMPEDWGVELTPILQKVVAEGPQLILRGVSESLADELRPFGDKSRPSASIMIVPIRNGAQLLGFLSIQSYTFQKYTTDDLHLLQSLSDYCAGALERIRAEEQLRASEKRYRILFDSNPTPVFVFDRNNLEILAANEAAIRLYGYSREEILKITIKDIRPPEDVPAFMEKMPTIRSQEKRFSVGRHQTKDGSLIDVDVISLPLVFTEREARLSMVTDVTERKKLEKEILEISAREQRRIGHDLHDGLCQHLAGVGFLSQILTDKLSEKSAPEVTDAQKITGLLNEALGKSRSLARGLFPVRLEENGLISALEELAASTESLFLTRCHFECDEPVLIRDNVLAENLYYIAHEALMNAIKHGKAKNVWIILQIKNDRCVLSIRDDGVGIPKMGTQQGMGLRIMGYRANMIGASLKIEPNNPLGTNVKCSFLRPEAARPMRK